MALPGIHMHMSSTKALFILILKHWKERRKGKKEKTDCKDNSLECVKYSFTLCEYMSLLLV